MRDAMQQSSARGGSRPHQSLAAVEHTFIDHSVQVDEFGTASALT